MRMVNPLTRRPLTLVILCTFLGVTTLDSTSTSHPAIAASSPSPGPVVSATPYNGGAFVEWPTSTAVPPPKSFNITATPLATSVNSTIPARNAESRTVKVPGDQHSVYVSQLLADCHTQYTFKVEAVDGSGTAHLIGTTESARPSGYLDTDNPPLVEVVIDGAGSEMKLGASPVSYDPMNQPSYCPEQPLSADGQHLPTTFEPSSMQGPLGKWYTGTGDKTTGPLDTQGNHTNWYLEDAYAATGAVILPYSYAGATLTRDSKARPLFTIAPFQADVSADGQLDLHANILQQELVSIHSVWKHSPILVIGHSYGGLIAEWWWQSYWAVGDHNGVTHVFSLDSPINGIARADFCNLTSFCKIFAGLSQTLFGVLAILWEGRDFHDSNIVSVDRSEGFPFTSIYTSRDPAYYSFAINGVFDERISQAVLPLDAGVSYKSPCDVPESGPLSGDVGHFLVKWCPATIAHIQELVPPPGPASCALASIVCQPAGPHGAPAFAARGQIVFASGTTEFGSPAFSVMNPDGAGIRPLSLPSGALCCYAPALSPDGTSLVFIAEGVVIASNADGTQDRNIWGPISYGFVGPPTWSAAGKEVAFVVYSGSPSSPSEIDVVNADGSSQHQVVKDAAIGPALSLAWSPDGSEIAFISSSGSIEIVSASGGSARPLTGPQGVGALSWAPGPALLFSQANSATAGQGIQEIESNGTGLRTVLSGPGYHDPSWSPNGINFLALTDSGQVVVAGTEGDSPTTIGPTGVDYAQWGGSPPTR